MAGQPNVGPLPNGEGCAWPQIPLVVKEAKAALAAGQCVVIGLQATGEAAAQVSIIVAASRSAAYVFLSTACDQHCSSS